MCTYTHLFGMQVFFVQIDLKSGVELSGKAERLVIPYTLSEAG